MLAADKTITIFNRYVDSNRKEHWSATVITGVSWQAVCSSQTAKEGLRTSESCIVRIPNTADTQGKEFLFCRSFLQNQDKVWTASPRDKIVLGVVKSAPDDDTLPTWLEKNCDAVLTVSTVADNRRVRQLPHIRIGGI